MQFFYNFKMNSSLPKIIEKPKISIWEVVSVIGLKFRFEKPAVAACLGWAEGSFCPPGKQRNFLKKKCNKSFSPHSSAEFSMILGHSNILKVKSIELSQAYLGKKE